MKKHVLTALMLALATSLFAQSPFSAVLSLQLSSDLGFADENVTLVEGSMYTPGYETGDSQKNMTVTNPSQNVKLYALTGFSNFAYAGMLATNNLDGVFLGVKTNTAETDYTITFKTVTGTTYYLIDLYEGVATPIVLNGTYDFEATAGAEINNRFLLKATSDIPYAATLTTNEDGWASFAHNADVALGVPSGLKIYKGALDLSTPEAPAIELTEVDAIPANAGVFVKGAPLTTYFFSATTAAALTGNDIVGCVAATPVDDALFANKYIYALRYANGATGLYNYEGTADIPAGKAVLPIAKGNFPVHAPAHISMRFGQTTAIDNVEAGAQAEKFIENGQVLIRRGNEVYNLQGQIVK